MLPMIMFAFHLYTVAAPSAVAPGQRQLVRNRPEPPTVGDWIWGPGGEAGAPLPPFTFIKENLGGTNPKVNVRDARGRLWIVKFSGEVHTDVFASRFLNALGYVTEPAYFVPSGVIVGAHELKRAKPFISREGKFRCARFKLRDDSALAYADELQWSWIDNPFAGSHELNGLKILMMLLSNWDAKDARDGDGSNTAVFVVPGSSPQAYLYAFTDWGSSLGSWGGFCKRDKWDADAYERQSRGFIKGVQNGTIIWGYSGKHGRDITADISVDDLRWLARRLAPITDEQLRAGLIASGASAVHASEFTRSLRDRIAQIQRSSEIGASNSN
jgi:hypothetical protein